MNRYSSFVSWLLAILVALVLGLSWVGCEPSRPDEQGNGGGGGGAQPPAPVYATPDAHPAWSPDGSTIAYSHQHLSYVDEWGWGRVDLDSTGIWLISPDGSNRRFFLRAGSEPAWAPHGYELVFFSGGGLWRVGADGKNLRRLTQKGEGRLFNPSWSPDGSLIAVRNVLAIDGARGIWLIDPVITWSVRYWGPGAGADWISSDELVYAGGGTVVREKLDHSCRQKLADKWGSDCSVSRDGSRIAFGTPYAERSVYVMNSDGSDLRLLAERGDDPAISPDGSRIVYVGWSEEPYNPEHNGVLYIVNWDGSGVRQLTPGVKRNPPWRKP